MENVKHLKIEKTMLSPNTIQNDFFQEEEKNGKEYDSNVEGSEEGEILDSMDSEEEYNMRQRIHELEAKNAELEKIAKISSDYTNQYKYTQIVPEHNLVPNHHQVNQRDVARIPSDASPISSDEFEPIKKHVKRKKRPTSGAHKRRYRPNDNENHRCKSRRTQKECHKKQSKIYLSGTNSPVVPNDYFETISLDSDDDTHQRNIKSSSEDDENPLHLNREELRFALARDKTENVKSKNLLKDRLCNSSFAVLRKNDDDVGKPDIVQQNFLDIEGDLNNSSKDEVISQEEQELRLIALKSAVLKKHLARKKRNAEIAYSPTDFEPVITLPKCDENMDVIEDELNELEEVMEISPIGSPKLVLSPADEEELKCSTLYHYTGNNNSVDMDIAESESDNENNIDGNCIQSSENPWSPIVLAPLTAQESQVSCQLEHPLPIQYGIYVPEMQYFPNPNDDEEPPPPPPFNINIISHNNSSLSRNSVFEHLGDKTDEIDNKSISHQFDPVPLLFSESISNESFKVSHSDKESDEEASALRAVLLSRLNQKNRQKDSNGVKFHIENTALEMNSANLSKKVGIETVLQKALRRLKSNFNSSYSNMKENKSYESNEIYNDILNETLENCPQTPSEEEGFVQTSFESHENSNSNTFNYECQKSNSPSFGENLMLPQTVKLNINKPTDDLAKNIPEDNLIVHTPEPALNFSTCSDTSSKGAKEIIFNGPNEATVLNVNDQTTLSLTTDKNSKHTISKNHTIQPARAQPLSVKNTLNQPSAIINKSFQAQLTTPLKKVRRTTKIIRRNKIINKEVTTSIKRAASKGAPMILTQPKPTHENVVNTNIQGVTTLEKVPPKITVKKLIISLRNSETETSDDEFSKELSLSTQNSVHNAVKQTDDMYNANSSPLELVMNNECNLLPYQLETPSLQTAETQQVITATSVAFEKKLDNFLKNIRAKETQQSKKHSPVKHPVDENTKIVNTPSAVRHLPLSAQDEYRRLVHRMKSLEKQKKLRISDTEETSKTPIFKSEKEITKDSELNILSSYEKSFAQTSEHIVALLNQSLSLVAEAKRAKLAKLHHERRLIELRIEMDRLTTEVKQEELKLNSMKPHLGKSNQFLITLKKKSRDLLHSANKLGKTIKGETYSLINKDGEEITSKSKKLQEEIKLVNALKADNMDQLVLPQNKETETSLVQHINNVSVVLPIAENVSAIQNQEKLVLRDKTPCERKEDSTQQVNNTQNKMAKKLDDANIVQNIDGIEETKPQVCLDLDSDAQTDDNRPKSEEVLQSIRSYDSPLQHLKNTYGYLDFNAILCPYEMWGKCADKCCGYLHMTVGRQRGTELEKLFKNCL